MPYEPLTKAQIISALRRLGELAQAEGSVLEISLYGGAAFTVVYGSRESTRDVDAIAHPSEKAKSLAAQVEHELGLAEGWLSDDVRFFLADKEAKRRLKGDEFGPGLQVSVPTAAYLLAMKLRACRAPRPGFAGDHGDIEFLARKMAIASEADAEKIYGLFFQHDALSKDSRDVLRKVIPRSGGK